MTKQRHISIHVDTAASPAAVFRLLADGSTWTTWSPIESFELEQQGNPPPEGVGAIRVFELGRTTGRDQLLEVVPDRRLAYASLSGLPVRDYVGQVDLTPSTDGSTSIHWHSDFFPKTPGTGWLVERSLHRFLSKCAHGLAEHAAKSEDSSTA